MPSEKLKNLEEQLADLKKRWPAHSVSPSLWQELEDLEERIKQAKEEEKNADV